MGGGLGGGYVQSLIVFDDGTGPALYAGGGITSAGGAGAYSVARWDGTRWTNERALSGLDSTLSHGELAIDTRGFPLIT